MFKKCQYRVCLVVRHDGISDIVASDIVFTSYSRANTARKKLLATDELRSTVAGKCAVVVMSSRTFRKLQAKGDACTVSRIAANAFTSGRRADLVSTPDELRLQKKFVEIEKQVRLHLNKLA